MTKIWYIHGANASPRSFSYIKQWLTKHDAVDIRYITDDPLICTLQDLEKRIKCESEMVHIVSHSLGGIIGVALAQRVPEKVFSVTTLATPFAGSSDATKALFIKPFDPFLMNASSLNPSIYQIKQTEIDVPLFKVITTGGGNTLMSEDNDGVVTVSSQRAYKNGEEKMVPLNHFEVLLSDDVARTISAFIAQVEQLEMT